MLGHGFPVDVAGMSGMPAAEGGDEPPRLCLGCRRALDDDAPPNTKYHQYSRRRCERLAIKRRRQHGREAAS